MDGSVARYVVSVKDKVEMMAHISLLQTKGYSFNNAAQQAFNKYGEPVSDAGNYCRYMAVGDPNVNEAQNMDLIVSAQYVNGEINSVDTNENGRRMAWGDDIMLVCLASLCRREILVVVAFGQDLVFMPHPPRLATENTPFFLWMDSSVNHYEPMVCQAVEGTGSVLFDRIGEKRRSTLSWSCTHRR